jgi:hypothetical protein
MKNEASRHVSGRYCAQNGVKELSYLEHGMDFRLPQYRREVFLRFYEFHLKYRAHPGGVYFLLPYLQKRYSWTKEQAYWFAYINGCTQNPLTSWVIWSRFPDLHQINLGELAEWFAYGGENYARLEFDTDRRYSKKDFVKMVKNYLENLGGRTQEEFFEEVLCGSDDLYANFRKTWEHVNGKFFLFGRLASFSYLEYLKIIGTPLDCDNLFLDDMSGSKSHRNGLCKVLGRDDLDWHDSNPSFEGYTKEIIGWLEKEGETLLGEAQERFSSRDFKRDVGYFTLESTLCNYKGWHRVNRRYPNVYNDMLHDRIKRAESRWGDRFEMFWDARKEYLPPALRLEDNPWDLGVHPEKQNHYRIHGEPVMLHVEWDCFRNKYAEREASSFESLFGD